MSETPTRQITAPTAYADPKDGFPVGASAAKRPELQFLLKAIIPLIEPIERSGVPITQLEMRRPKVADNKYLNDAQVPEGERGARLMAHLCGLTPDEFGQLDMADIALMGEWLELFTSARKRS